ncbi:hypothetical protein C8A05DRAFT_37548 [Staphylotrichum tortipilum]|uniref:Uncharacterized protein n=1 Tax=Staphylotrichum tortipilum TaxID=2831512 RepID=A0AAN6RQW0_9PEZI|nr:hypothetical protein C8A05DRAFT_37548 [Staphylotrichum longicolle]
MDDAIITPETSAKCVGQRRTIILLLILFLLSGTAYGVTVGGAAVAVPLMAFPSLPSGRVRVRGKRGAAPNPNTRRDEDPPPLDGTQPAGQKQKKGNQTGGSENNGENDDGNEGVAASKPRRRRGDCDVPVLACPFWMLNPIENDDCLKLVLADTPAVVQHVLRNHRMPFICPICHIEQQRCCEVCGQEFASPPECQGHVQSGWCEARETRHKGADEDKCTKIKERKTLRGWRNGSEEWRTRPEEWRWHFIWGILFPGVDHPARSPFLKSVEAEILTDFSGSQGLYRSQNIPTYQDLFGSQDVSSASIYICPTSSTTGGFAPPPVGGDPMMMEFNNNMVYVQLDAISATLQQPQQPQQQQQHPPQPPHFASLGVSVPSLSEVRRDVADTHEMVDPSRHVPAGSDNAGQPLEKSAPSVGWGLWEDLCTPR